MKITTIVYKQFLVSKGLKKDLLSLVRKVMIKLLCDPSCSLIIHGRLLKIPLSHQLPCYLKHSPFYDRLPQRISEYVHKTQGYLNCIDVGANIGDSVASFYKDKEDRFLAIEPNPKFNKLLYDNWGWNSNVKITSDICSSGNDEATFKIKEKNGTASIIQSADGTKIKKSSLDKIVNDYHFATNVNVLKIDTDGHDFKVIKGAIGVLSKYRPVILFECDIFSNTSYVQDCIKTLLIFKKYGYKHFLLYDNSGYLLGKYALSDLGPFRKLLFYQLTSNSCYFDILFMQEEDINIFYKSEINCFVKKISKSLQQTAITALEH